MVILIISEEICANNCKIHEKGVHNREIRVVVVEWGGGGGGGGGDV